MTVTTDNKWKEFKPSTDVPEDVLENEFDWMGDPSFGFFKYLNSWYHISEFIKFGNNESIGPWQAYSPESAFSAVLVQVSNDGEEYKVGTFYTS